MCVLRDSAKQACTSVGLDEGTDVKRPVSVCDTNTEICLRHVELRRLRTICVTAPSRALTLSGCADDFLPPGP